MGADPARLFIGPHIHHGHLRVVVVVRVVGECEGRDEVTRGALTNVHVGCIPPIAKAVIHLHLVCVSA